MSDDLWLKARHPHFADVPEAVNAMIDRANEQLDGMADRLRAAEARAERYRRRLERCRNRISHRKDCQTMKLTYMFTSGRCTCGADDLEHEIRAALRGEG